MPDRPEFLLRLRALPSDVPPVYRLKRALKTLLRVYEFRCVSVEHVAGQLDDRPTPESRLVAGRCPPREVGPTGGLD